MSRARNLERVWRKSPHAFVPIGLALGGWLVGAVTAAMFPAAGHWPYALPFAALAVWALGVQVRLQPHVPARRGTAKAVEPTVAGALARRPLGIALLGIVLMGAYFLMVGTVFGEPWLGSDTASGAYGVALMGVTVALYGWEIVFGAAARRARLRAMQHGSRTHTPR